MSIEAILKPLREFLSKMTRGQKIQLAIAGVVFITVIVVLVVILGRTPYAMLFSGLEPTEAGQINARLTEAGVTTKLEANGTTIMVPEKDVDRLRLELAAEGIPQTGDTYSHYLNNQGMSSTDADKQVLEKQQKEIDLAQAIKTYSEVKQAQVRANIPVGSSMIKSESKQATASVFLELVGQDSLEQNKANGIINLVSYTFGIDTAYINVTDNLGNSYKIDSESSVGMANSQRETEELVKQNYKNAIDTILEPVYGEGHYSIMLDLTMNWDEVLEETNEFTQPDGSMDEGGLAVAIEKVYESTGTAANAEGNPGIDSNGGSVPEYPETLDATSDSYQRMETKINNELNEANTKISRAQGQISDIHVSITIDENLDVEDHTQQFTELIANALRTDQENVEVRTVPYIDNSEEQQKAIDEYNEHLKDVQSQQLIRTILIVVGILGAVFLIAKVVRDVSRNNLEAKRAQAAAVAKYTDKAMGANLGENVGVIDEDKKRPERMQIEDFIDRSPESVAQLLRNWISEDAR